MNSLTRRSNRFFSSSSKFPRGVGISGTGSSKPSCGNALKRSRSTIFWKAMPGSSRPLLARDREWHIVALIQRLRKLQIDQVERGLIVRVLRRHVVQRLVFHPIRDRRINRVVLIGDQIVILRISDRIAGG